jgi:hypothetical protein
MPHQGALEAAGAHEAPWAARFVAECPPTTLPPPQGALRDRLIALRADTLRQLAGADFLVPGFLQLLAGINAAMVALDAVPPEDAALADRAIIADDGREIRLTLFTGVGAVAAVALNPQRAVDLAGKLIAAALPKLGPR